MNNIIDPERLADLRMKKLQQLSDDYEMSEYVLTGGAFVDGLNSGVSIEDMQNFYMQSRDCLEFERKVWAKIKKIGE